MAITPARFKTIRTGFDCVDCGKPCYAHHLFVVRNEVWQESGMQGWDSGWLHQACLEKRLGRKLQKQELLVWGGKRTKTGCVLQYSADYLTSREYLEH